MLYSEWNTVVMEKSTQKSTNLRHQNVVLKKKQNYLVLDKHLLKTKVQPSPMTMLKKRSQLDTITKP